MKHMILMHQLAEKEKILKILKKVKIHLRKRS